MRHISISVLNVLQNLGVTLKTLHFAKILKDGLSDIYAQKVGEEETGDNENVSRRRQRTVALQREALQQLDAKGAEPSTKKRSPTVLDMSNVGQLEEWWAKHTGSLEGVLGREMLVLVLTQMGFASEAQRSVAVHELDSDGDGSVTLQEYKKWLTTQDAGAQERWVRLEQTWKEVDTDASGTLDREETRLVLERMGYVTYAAKKAAILTLDANHDGEVDFGEFCQWFSQHGDDKQEAALLKCVRVCLPTGRLARPLATPPRRRSSPWRAACYGHVAVHLVLPADS
jgi:Ca2+-binding EF-hand superfamily protein